MIHQNKTKEIITVSEVWNPVLISKYFTILFLRLITLVFVWI